MLASIEHQLNHRPPAASRPAGQSGEQLTVPEAADHRLEVDLDAGGQRRHHGA